jgi:hypothetical protein
VRFVCLLPLGACAHHYYTRRHTNHFVYGGNKARDVSPGSLTVKTAGSGPGEACRKIHQRPTCAWGRPGAIHGVTRPGAWPLREIPCEGLQRGLGESLSASRYLDKNTGVVNGSLHLYLIFTLRTLLPWLSVLLS